MKKELCAALLLLLLLAGTIFNIYVVGRITDTLQDEIDAAYEYFTLGDTERAGERVDAAISRWLSLDGYTHIFIRHSEISSTTEAFYNFKADILSGDIGAAEASYGLLSETLLSLKTMEQLSFGSIF